MSAAEIVFWCAAALIGYAYVLYPLLVLWLARRFGRAPHTAPCTPSLTVVITAYNESARIGTRVRDVLAQDYPRDKLRVIVVDDGSSDGTWKVADVGDPRVQVIRLAFNVGKAAALAIAIESSGTDIIAFADARQRFAPQALRKLMEPFADPRIGAVSGELVIESASGTAADIGLYWRMEKALRDNEARLGWVHGVSGAIHALRRELAKAPPPGTILDDMYLPLAVVFAGKRVAVAREAIALDRASADAWEEFRRKLRTLAGNWQLIARLPRLANPFANPVFFAWFSHKFLRLIVPWALLAMPIACAFEWQHPFYRAALVVQLAGYAGAAFALLRPRFGARVPLLRTIGSFVMLNAAALLSLPACLALDPRGLWKSH
ncbi:MAG TPA: glycosyltransferase family 2 protein [Rhodanobacteraceae bacterium]|nr:glycosyltransferase family 2 protein [Rhodanobacteraceae bacterium]